MALLVLVGSFAPLISTLNFTISPPSLTLVSQTTAGTSPSWLLNHPGNQSIVYATDENDIGAINSLVLDKITGNLTLVGTIATQGGGPTHLGFVNDGKQIGAANFNGGSAFFATLESDLLHFGDSQLVSFNPPGNNTAHAHEIVPFGNDVLVPDLGQDQVWRLGLENGTFVVQESIQQDPGSGPRHIVVDEGSLYTLHELANTLTQQTISADADGPQPQLVASFSIVPSDTDAVPGQLHAGELLFAPSPTPLLYASNREDTSPAGDAIAIFEITPDLKRVGTVRTGLKHLRGVAFMGNDNEFLIAGGLNGGGIKVFERVSADEGFLKEIASLPEGVVDQPTSFVSTSAFEEGLLSPSSVSVPSVQLSSYSGTRITSVASGAIRPSVPALWLGVLACLPLIWEGVVLLSGLYVR